MERFTVTAISHDQHVVVKVAGDIDLAVADQLGQTLVGYIEEGPALHLDCSGVTFIDSMGLRALLQAASHASDQGKPFHLVRVPKSVRRILDLAGVAEVFGVIPGSAGEASL